MTEIDVEINTMKQIRIQRLQKRTLEQFVHVHCNDWDGVKPMWCDGMVVALYSFPDIEAVIRDKLGGIINYEEVSYADCPQYKQILARDDIKYEVRVTNMDHDDFFKFLVSVIRKFEKDTLK